MSIEKACSRKTGFFSYKWKAPLFSVIQPYSAPVLPLPLGRNGSLGRIGLGRTGRPVKNLYIRTAIQQTYTAEQTS